MTTHHDRKRRHDTVRVLVRPELVLNKKGDASETLWVAQCVEKDVAAQGKTPEEAIYSFQRVYLGFVVFGREKNRDLLKDFPDAPVALQREFDAGGQREKCRRFKVDFKYQPDYGIAKADLPDFEAKILEFAGT